MSDTKAKIIYVCTKGEYSDYRIVGVLDSKELADIFSQKFECEVEEYRVNPFTEELKNGYEHYFLRMTKGGDVDEIYIDSDFYSSGETFGFDIQGNMYFYCMAKDEKHAVKIANEHRSMLIATKQWEAK